MVVMRTRPASQPEKLRVLKSSPTEKPVTRADAKEYVRHNSRMVQSNPTIYVPELKVTSSNPSDTIDKLEFGDRKYNVPEKVIMILGATRSGKTTLINGFVNYVFGVEWKDPYRFKLIQETNSANQAMSQTTKITSYTLHHQEGFRVPYSLTIIDTPGFGDVSGIKRDREITESIRKFFTTPGAQGISHIDAVGFVANSSLPRLTPTQRYIFDQILSLFGKDIADNIFLLLTFADGKKPQVLSGIKEAKIPYKKHFKFNNSALYARRGDACDSKESDSDDEGDGNFDTMFWDMGFKSFNLFLDQLNSVESKSLFLTQDVLNERNRLETYIAGMQRDIRLGLSTLERLKEEKDMLHDHHANIERNKNFEYEVNDEFNALQVKVLGMTRSVRKSLQRLKEIALRPNPLTTVQYIDILIESERSQAEPGWQARLEQLNNVKKEVEYMEMIADQGFDPFKQYAEKLELKMRHSKSNVWTKVFDYYRKGP